VPVAHGHYSLFLFAIFLIAFSKSPSPIAGVRHPKQILLQCIPASAGLPIA